MENASTPSQIQWMFTIIMIIIALRAVAQYLCEKQLPI